jgi:glycosyltransferase involved in cell wall biosynthesis
MNVLYVSESPTLSGAEVVLLGDLDHFTGCGCECSAYLPAVNVRLVRELERRGVPIAATSSYSRILLETTLNPASLAHFARAFWRVGREIERLLRDRRIDLIHSISYPASLYAALPARRAGVAHLWHEHNIKRIHRVNRHLYRFAGRSCAWVVGPSDAVTRNLARAGIEPRKLRTVYNGIDLSRFRLDAEAAARVRHDLGVAPGEPAVGLFGQMLAHKGHRTLIDAAPMILRARPAARFFFVGALENPPYQEALRQQLRAADLESRFVFTGWRTDVQDVIQAMDAVVVATTTPEPAALALMETMAMGRPIVASRTGGTPEIVRDGVTGLLFQPGDAADLAGRVTRVLSDRAFADALGCAGRLLVEREFSADRHLREMGDLYAAAAPDRGRLTPRR